MAIEAVEAQHRITGSQCQDPVELSLTAMRIWVLQVLEWFNYNPGILKIGHAPPGGKTIVDMDINVQGDATDVVRITQDNEVQDLALKCQKGNHALVASIHMSGHPESSTLLVLYFMDEKGSRAKIDNVDSVYEFEIHGWVHSAGIDMRIFPVVESARRLALQLAERLEARGPQSTVPGDMADMSISEGDLGTIWTWNSQAAAPVERCVHDLISERARQTPNAPAVCAWDGELDYEQLDDFSSRLAHYLIEVGATATDFIPLCFEKSVWMMVAILGVMKSGAVISAMDPTQPEDRLRTIVQQLRPAWIMCSPAQRDVATRLRAGSVITLDHNLIQSLPPSGCSKLPSVDPASTLYVVFTSGSTGTPKGAIINHTNFSSAITYQHKALGINSSARVLDFASYAFDLAWGNIIHTFASGACLCIPQESERRGDIAAAMRRLEVNHVQLTPSVARLIDPNDVPSLRLILLIGEPMSQADVDQWTPHCTLINSYGPAECTVAVTFQTISSDGLWDGSMGTGVACNTWVVDGSGENLLPPGSTGELWLEGPLVGQGYLRDSEKTVASYVENPLWLAQGGPGYPGRRGRLYKTGDLVRYNKDGRLVYVARKDDQVKVRGQRVELAEVEFHLKQALPDPTIPVVAEVITPRGGKSAILVAYLALGPIAMQDMDQVKDELRRCTDGLAETLTEQLPQYMVPSFYIPVSEIPMTGTGKTDRRRLRESSSLMTMQQLVDMQPSRGERCEPRTDMERRLQHLWALSLGIDAESIRVNDSFLQVGGDSVAAIRLVQLARKEALVLTVADVFNLPRLCDLAEVARLEQPKDIEIPPFSLLPQIDNAPSNACTLAAAECGVPTESIVDLLPCSPLQEGLLALTGKRPGDYIRCLTMDLPSDVDLAHFRYAWSKVVQLVSVLRTRIVELPTLGLIQVVLAEGPEWHESDDDLDSFVQSEKETYMGLNTPLARFGLVKDNSQKVSFIWTIHHALFDGWSMPLLLEQVESIYWHGDCDMLAPFNGFVKYLTDSGQGAEEYWRSQLDGIEAPIFPPLPSSGYQPQAQNQLQHQIVNISWPDTDITASTVVRAAWAILTSRYTHSSDVIFGATLTGRQAPVPYIERIAGPTIATVPIRVNTNGDLGVASLLQNLQKQAVDMISYEQTGLKSIRRTNPDADHATQFQTLLVVQPATRKTSQPVVPRLFPEDLYDWEDELAGINTYALILQCHLEPNGLLLRMSFDSQVIEVQQAERISRQFEEALRQICSKNAAEDLISAVEVASPEDLAQIRRWNERVSPAIKGCPHEVIAQHVQEQPDRPAVCAWDGQLTYEALGLHSTNLARFILRLGAGPGTVIPICFEKSMWTPVAMLAAIKTGSMSVTVDPSQPQDRLQSIMHQVQPPLILTSAMHESLAARLAPQVIIVDADSLQGMVPSVPNDFTMPFINPASGLYIAFTSGSTGTPKGAIMTHENFRSGIHYQRELMSCDKNTRLYDFSSYAFDAAWLNFFHSLTAGGCLCIPSDAQRKDDISGSMEDLQANYALLTPSTTRTLDPKTLPSLRTLMLVGEAVTSEDLRKWAPHVILKNGYGPAECSALSTVHTFEGSGDQPSTIGFTVGLRSWIVEPIHGICLTPLGAIGELWLEGPLVGAGYLGDPDRTAASFVRDPSWLLHEGPSCLEKGCQGRLYKTGDLVRYNQNGSLSYVGRKDTQVKIRGQRVELEEVESYLRQTIPGGTAHTVIADMVTLRGNSSPSLVAYIALGETATKAPETVRAELSRCTHGVEEFLGEHLPSYMVPNLYIPVTDIPISTTGKTDRKRLRQLGSSMSLEELLMLQSRREKRLPETELEHQLRDLWADILNIDVSHIGVDDGFFSLGGDSISAMQLSAKSRQIGFRITVRDIFNLKTIGLLAHSGKKEDVLEVKASEQVDKTFALSPIQQLFFDSQSSTCGHFNQSFFVRISRRQNSDFVLRAVESVVTRHSMLRARFQQEPNRRWVQRITPSTGKSYIYHQLSVSSLDDAIPALNMTQQSLDIQEGPLFAANLIDTDDMQYLFLVAHHLVIDLVSWRIILDDIEQMLKNSAASALPSFSSLPFQTWCHLQASYASENLAPEFALPFDIGPACIDYWGLDQTQNTHDNIVEQGFAISKSTTGLLLGAANHAFQTQPVDLFQAALLHSFMQVFDDRTIPTIFTEGHGREPWDQALDLSRTVGWFTTISPTAVTASSDLGIAEVVARTKDGRRRTPRNGWPYFTSRYLNAAGKESFGVSHCHEVVFNYFGLYQQLEKADALFQPCGTLAGRVPDVAGHMHRFALIDVAAEVTDGCLRFEFQYNRHMQKIPALRKWITACQRSLEAAAEELVSLPPRYTVSDFPLLPQTDETRRKVEALPDLGISFGEIADIYPCSPVQQGILLSQAKSADLYQTRVRWLVQSVDPQSAVDVQRLAHSWCLVVARHGALRTIFTHSMVSDGYNDQIVLKEVSPPIHILPPQHLQEGMAAVAGYPRTVEDRDRVLHSLVLCPTSVGSVYCQLDINHAIIDAISMSIIKQDLRSAYSGSLPSQPAPLYSDYIQYIQTRSSLEAREYWQGRVAGAEPCIFPVLNQDHVEPNARGIAFLPITQEIYRSLRSFCRAHGLTPSNVLHLAWGLVLRCYTSNESVCFGYLSSGRDVPVDRADGVVGPLINILVSHAKIASDRSLLSMMQDNQRDYLDGLKYQHYPLAEVLHDLNADAERFFNTALSVQSGGLSQRQEPSGISLDEETWDDPNEYDMATSVFLREDDAQISINYSYKLLSETQAASVAGSFLEALRVIIEEPETSVDSLQIASPQDIETMWNWNRQVPKTVSGSVTDLIGARIQQQPEAPAVCSWDGELTYRELDKFSSRLAQQLLADGVPQNSIIPLCFEKSMWVPVAMLAVMKAGCAGVGMDPEQPKERLQLIIAKAQPPLILTSPTLRGLAQSLLSTVITVSLDSLQAVHSLDKYPFPPSHPTDTLFIAFTSGSTGTPKGGIISHENMCSAISHHSNSGITSSSRVFDFASYSFDAAWFNFIYPLVAGGCMCIPSDEQRKNQVVESMEQLRVNYTTLTSSMARTINPTMVPSLETLVLGGEALGVEDLDTWTHTNLKAVYGPAECTFFATIKDFKHRNENPRTLGHAVGLTSWVVEPLQGKSLVPIGAIGELWLEGPLVGPGYLRDPEKTAASRAENPAWLVRGTPWHPGRRGNLYKTGDLVQYCGDGALIYITRKDNQVKIRGQRVELAEVEYHAHRALPATIKMSLVAEVVYPKGSDNPILVAFVSLGEKESGPEESIRETLASCTKAVDDNLTKHLPSYMVPSMYVPVAEIPLTATGKTDRRRIQQIGSSLSLEQLAKLNPSSRKRRAPRTAIEQRLQKLWATILGREATTISADDSFLKIGGDSIGAIRLVRLAADHGLMLTVATIFNSPTLCDMAQKMKIGSVSEQEIPPLSLLKSQVDSDQALTQAAAQCGLDVSSIEDVLPCTPLQEGLLSLTVKRPGGYVIRQVLRLHEQTDIERFQNACNHVAMSTSILRTRIIDLHEQGLVQVVTKEIPEWHESTSLPAFLRLDENNPVGLGTALARFALVHDCLDDRVYSVWTLHHALYDGWSMPLILKEVEKAYFGHETEGLGSFAGFVKHIIELGTETDEYWQNEFDGLLAVQFPPLPSPQYQPRAQEVMRHEITNLQWLQDNTTPSTAIRAAWSVLVSHYTQSSDVIFGSTVTGRQAPVPKVELVEGPTIATVPIRVKIQEKATVANLLEQIQKQSVDMIPFEQAGLQRIRRISPEAERACGFQALLVVQPASQPATADHDDWIFKEQSDDLSPGALNSFNSYAMMLECQLTADGVSINISYDAHIVTQAQVGSIARQLEHVLRQICRQASHDLEIKHIEAASEDDIHRIWNLNSPIPRTVDTCMHDLISQQARQHPNASAIRAWDGELTYGQLDDLSTRLAHHLVEAGVHPGAIVALCLEKSMWMPVAMLGVMKAGATGATMDITQPEDRLRLIVQQVQPPLILSSLEAKNLASRLTEKVVLVISEETLEHRLGPEMETKTVLPAVLPSSGLYVAFTSGSTGVPKAALMTHRNFASAVYHQQSALGFTLTDQVFDFSSYAFDAAWLNFLHTMSVGACLCIPSEDERRNDVTECMRRMRVTYANLTPSTARLIDPASVPDLRCLVLVGEAVSKQDISQWSPYVELKNGYGPAECSAISTTFNLGESDNPAGTIGPGRGMATWVVEPSEGRHLSPYGAVGELWLEGPLVGAGYIGLPDINAATFIHDPAWLLQGGAGLPGRRGRLYKTGDLVRYNSDGTLLYVGRRDAQVKIRGQRVELTEVEHYLYQSLPTGSRGVPLVVDVITPRETLNPILVAFLGVGVLDWGSTEAVRAELRKHTQDVQAQMAELLPSFMVPSIFIPVPEIPVTATGKTDKRTLRELGERNSLEELVAFQPTQGERQTPTTETERRILELWAETLNIHTERISIHDDFFTLGGDSISAMQLSAKSRSTGISITVPAIFKHRTIARLAACTAPADQIMTQSTERLGVPFPLSPIQQLFVNTQQGADNHFNQSFLVRITRPTTSSQLNKAIEAIVAHHSMLRARFSSTPENIWTQQILPASTGSYLFSSHELVSFQESADVITQSQTSLDIENGPLFAVDLFNTQREGQFLFLVAHHMVIDLVSWRILLADLEEYLTTGTLSGFTPMSFQTWCELQADYARDHLSPKAVLPYSPEPPQYDYWGVAPSTNTFGNMAKGSIVLSKEVTDTVLGPANAAFNTQPVEILHAALLHSFTKAFHDRSPPSIFSEGHGREPWTSSIDLSRTVGWFTTIFPVVATVDPTEKISALVRRIKDTRRRVPQNGWSYFTSRYLNPAGKRDFQINGPVEIIFNYLGLYQQLERQESLFQLSEMPVNVDDLSDIASTLCRFALIDISASVLHGRLRVDYLYNNRMRNQKGIRKWIQECQYSLEGAARELLSLQPSYTICDFPLLDMSEYGLEKLTGALSRMGVSYGQIEDIYPCSPIQQGILMSQVKNPKLYQTTIKWLAESTQATGPLNVTRLKQAWQLVVDRHPMLRTIFINSIMPDGLMDQLVLKRLEAEVHVITSGQCDAAESAKQRENNASLVIYATESRTTCELSINHALIDGSSLGILKQELCAAYDGSLSSSMPGLYSEYIQFLQSLPEQKAHDYWNQLLEGISPCIFPSIDGRDPHGPRSKSVISRTFDPSMHDSLRLFCMDHGLTTSNVFHIAWGLVLRAYTGLGTVCFGYLTSGRDIPVSGAERTIGPFINMLTSRVSLESDESLLSLAQKNQGQYLSSLEFQHYPLAKIFHFLDLPGKELFNTALSVQASRLGSNNSGSSISLSEIGGDDPTEVRIQPGRNRSPSTSRLTRLLV